MSPKITLRYLKPSISSHPPANRGWIVMRGLFRRKPAGNLYLDILDWLDAGERWIRSRIRSGTMNGPDVFEKRTHMRSDPHWWYTRSLPAISWRGLRSAESMRRAIDPSLIRRHMFELRMGRTLFFCLFDVCLCGSYGVMGGDPYRNPRVMNILWWLF